MADPVRRCVNGKQSFLLRTGSCRRRLDKWCPWLDISILQPAAHRFRQLRIGRIQRFFDELFQIAVDALAAHHVNDSKQLRHRSAGAATLARAWLKSLARRSSLIQQAVPPLMRKRHQYVAAIARLEIVRAVITGDATPGQGVNSLQGQTIAGNFELRHQCLLSWPGTVAVRRPPALDDCL